MVSGPAPGRPGRSPAALRPPASARAIAVRAGPQGRKKPGPTANGAGRLSRNDAGTAQRFPQTYVRDYRRPRRTARPEKARPHGLRAGRLQAKGAGTDNGFPQTSVREYRRPRRIARPEKARPHGQRGRAATSEGRGHCPAFPTNLRARLSPSAQDLGIFL